MAKTKTSIQVKADSVQMNANNSTVRFVVEAAPAPPAKDGEPPRRMAKTIVQIVYADNASAGAYTVGKDYTISIEG